MRLQAALNYKEILSGQPAIAKKADYTLSQHIMQTEREAVMCQSLHNAAAVSAAESTFRQPVVVGVVGEAHIEGIAQMWEGDKWRAIVDSTVTGEKYAEHLIHLQRTLVSKSYEELQPARCPLHGPIMCHEM